MKLVVCETAEQILMAQRLRYEVYCLEKGWIDPAQCPDGIESDEYDDEAAHFLIMHDDGERLLGTSRLLRGECQDLPATHYLDLDALGIDPAKVVEVSRMATIKSSRSQSLAVFLAITQVMFEWCTAHGVTSWVSIADVSVFALMKRVGMPIIVEGPRIDFLGSTCVPSCVDVLHTGDVLEKRGFRAQDVNPF